jgi:hypothetical protein
MLITNQTMADYWFGPMHLLAGVGETLVLDDTSDTALYLLDDSVADSVNTLVQAGMITVTGANTPFPRPTGVPALLHGDGSPQGKVYGGQGSLYLRRDNTGGQTALLTKTTGVTYNTGWAAVSDPWSGLNQALGLQASVCPIQLLNSALTIALGYTKGCGVWLNAGTVITGLTVNVLTAGSGLTYAALGIYNADYALVASTASNTAPFETTGWAQLNLTSPYVVPTTGLYYLADLYVSGTGPTIACYEPGGTFTWTELAGQFPYWSGPSGESTLPATVTPTTAIDFHWMGAY